MSGKGIGTPGSVRQDIVLWEDGPVSSSPLPPSRLDDRATRADIAELAYLLWKERGCPSGSAESDWVEAAQRVQERFGLGALQL